MKIRIVHIIAILGIATMVLSLSLLTNRQKRSSNCVRNEAKGTLKDITQPEKATLRNITRLTFERRASAFKTFGYASLTLMKKTDDVRPVFEYLRQPWKTKCSDEAADGADVAWSMIVAVKSDNTDKRRFIRETWGSKKFFNGARLEILFIVGLPTNIREEASIAVESSMNGDILQINKTEEYKSVGLKTIVGMQWVASHCHSNWIYASSDDDMVPHMAKFYQMFESQGVREMAKSRASARRFPIICNFRTYKNCGPVRKTQDKNYVPLEVYSKETYPTFCAGGFYTMTVEVSRILSRLSRSHKYFYNDDVWITGLLRLAAIHSSYLPCDDVTDEQCAILPIGYHTVRHFDGSIKNMIKFWEEQETKSSSKSAADEYPIVDCKQSKDFAR